MSKISNFSGMVKAGAMALAVAATLGVGTSAYGALLLRFNPDNDTVTPGISLDAGTLELEIKPSSISSGDGAAAALAASGGGNPLTVLVSGAGGITIDLPFAVGGLLPYGGYVDGSLNSHFYDTELVLTGLKAVDPASVISFPGFEVNIQSLTLGTFAFISTYGPGGIGDRVTLLTGTIATSSISSTEPFNSGGVTSSTITYTGGAIFPAMLLHGYSTVNGSLSWDLGDPAPSLTVPPAGILVPFSSQVGGSFRANVVPEPASLAVMGLSALGLLTRSRRRQA